MSDRVPEQLTSPTEAFVHRVAVGATERANTGEAPLNPLRQVTVICGGGGSTDFVIDVSGYYL